MSQCLDTADDYVIAVQRGNHLIHKKYRTRQLYNLFVTRNQTLLKCISET